jgi:solute carrier family 25 folate transporter 32
MKEWTANHSAIAGAGAGIVTSIAGCPLDVIKTKLQAQQFAHGSIAYKGAVGASFPPKPSSQVG